MKVKEKEKQTYMYRVRGRNVDDYCLVPYQHTSSISSVGSVIGDFLNKNLIFEMRTCVNYSEQTFKKTMVILLAKDSVIEIEKPIYDNYKEEINKVMAYNMARAVNKYIYDGKTKVVVNFISSGCEYYFKGNGGSNGVNDICGLKTLFISLTNQFDIKLFKNIICDFIGEHTPTYEFLDGDNLLLKVGGKSLVFNKNAYDLMISTVAEQKENLNKSGKSKVI